ncbi:hypothetical protein [Herbiconiux sp. A18JL235]|uniref:DUF4232 domain-containing protein n=1 Tax=Herbiconiux sp. A18JL235 TaxID=3152363 RepID=A0AB39BK50_9MICO
MAGLVLAAAATTSGCTMSGPEGDTTSATAAVAATPSVAATPAPTSAPTVVDGVGLEILQSRTDYATRGLQVSITNAGDEPIVVTAASFESPHFATPAHWSGAPVEVPPGLTRHLPVALGAAVCPAPEGPSELIVELRGGGDSEGSSGGSSGGSSDSGVGDARTVRGEPSDPFGALSRIASEDCLQHAVAETAALSFSALRVEGSGPGSTALLELRIAPTGAAGGPVLQLTEVRPSILLQPRNGGSWPLDLEVEPGDPPSALTLEAVPARCDPHAVAEDKRGTVLPLDLVLDDGTDGTVDLAADAAVTQQVYDFIAESCGFATE